MIIVMKEGEPGAIIPDGHVLLIMEEATSRKLATLLHLANVVPELARLRDQMDRKLAGTPPRASSGTTTVERLERLDRLETLADRRALEDDMSDRRYMEAELAIAEQKVPSPFCMQCDTDTHLCPGCGEGMGHGQATCSICATLF